MIKSINNMKFKRKLILSYIIVIIIPVSMLGIFSYYKSAQNLKEKLITSFEKNTAQLTHNVETKINKSNEFLKYTVISPYLINDLSNEHIELISLVSNANKYFEPIIWYNLSLNRDLKSLKVYSNNIPYESGLFFGPDEEVINQVWYQETMKQSKSQLIFQNDEFFLARRIYDTTTQKLIGVVKLVLNFDYIMNTAIVKDQDELGILMLDSTGKPIYHESFEDSQQTLRIEGSIKDEASNSMTVNNKNYYVISNALKNNFGTLIYYVPEEYFSSGTGDILTATFTVVLICFGILFMIVILFTETFVKRIELLSSEMENVNFNNLELNHVDPYKDEIGQLSRTFHRMINEINHLINQVYESNMVLKETELKVLKSQVNPHFLYNTLSLINWKAIEIENKEISDITQFLSAFYRTSLNKGKDLIGIESELENIRAYINIQLLMHDHDFDVRYQIEEEVLTYTSLNFILQPLVENAILHGIDECERDGFKGEIIVGAKVTNKDITFEIIDNGKGMTKDERERLLSYEAKGYGIKNVQERIHLFYGEQYGLSIFSEINKGTKIMIKIPVKI